MPPVSDPSVEQSGYRSKHPGSSLLHMLFFDFCRLSAALFLRVVHRAFTLDVDRVPARGPLLIVANHQSFYDPPLVGCYIHSRHTDFIARAGLFRIPLLATLIRPLNTIPIAEAGGDTAAMKEALRRLGEGKAVVIFPEGTRTPDGAMREFKRGISVLVKRAKCPVLPAALDGVYDALPRGKAPNLFGPRVGVAYGQPIPHAELMEHGPDEALRRLEREIDILRLNLRAEIRRRSKGKWPSKGPADAPFAPSTEPAEDI